MKKNKVRAVREVAGAGLGVWRRGQKWGNHKSGRVNEPVKWGQMASTGAHPRFAGVGLERNRPSGVLVFSHVLLCGCRCTMVAMAIDGPENEVLLGVSADPGSSWLPRSPCSPQSPFVAPHTFLPEPYLLATQNDPASSR